ncbi:MAG: TIGR01777 family oxidoreductase, partial [Bacteroidota bacterium]
INFAGEPLDAKRWLRSQKERIIGSRVDATSAIVHAISKAKQKPSVMISASGVGYYGAVETGEVTEDAPRGSDFLSETTYQWEKAAHGAEALGVRTVVLRIAVVLGSGGGALRKMLIPFRLFVGGPLGSGRQWFPWVHRDDLVGVILFALSSPEISGPVNVVAPEVVKMQGFCSALGQALHRPSWAPVPSFVLKAVLGEMSEMVLTGQRAVPRVLERYGYRFKFPQLSAALTDILK